MSLDSVLSNGDLWNLAIRAENSLGMLFVIDAEGTWCAGIRNAANTLWLKRADTFSSETDAQAWGVAQLLALAEGKTE